MNNSRIIQDYIISIGIMTIGHHLSLSWELLGEGCFGVGCIFFTITSVLALVDEKKEILK